MKFKILFNRTVPKDYGSPSEDNHKLSDTCIALSDGASVAFNSQIWSKILTRQFVKDTFINDDWILKAKKVFHRYHQIYHFKGNSIPWNVIESYENGSYATLLGLEITENNNIKIISIGDTIAVRIYKDKFVSSFPIDKFEDFDSYPFLISTDISYNKYIDKNFIAKYTTEWKCHSSTLILLMTDALGYWFLSDKEKGLKKVQLLFKAKNQEKAFKEFVFNERKKGKMKLDDSTLIVVGFIK